MAKPEIYNLPTFRDEFVFPSNADVGGTLVPQDAAEEPCTYLCGNSLGLLSKRSRALINEELAVWGQRAVEGHWDHPHGRNWVSITDTVHPSLAKLIGAKDSEVACMSTLTANLHLTMNTFYKPTAERYKILCEAHAFPSDQYAFASQALLHGFDPEEAVLELAPRPGEHTLRESDILETISREGPRLALVVFSGVQYYTGQFFPIESITKAAQAQGAICGWDLAHAIGNVPLALHAWSVDFAVWCSYKYLNSGPGGIGGLFIHEKWDNQILPKYAGWWGHDTSTRFLMPHDFSPIRGAQGFQQSNPSVLATASLLGSVRVFDDAGGIEALRLTSIALTGHLEGLLRQSGFFVDKDKTHEAREKGAFTIITPSDPQSRGAQLSLLFLPKGSGTMEKVFGGLKKRGIIGDERRPDVIRLAPAPLYNTIKDCVAAATALEEVFNEL